MGKKNQGAKVGFILIVSAIGIMFTILLQVTDQEVTPALMSVGILIVLLFALLIFKGKRY